MFPMLLTFRIIIFLLLLPFILFWRMRRKGHMSHLTALLLKEIILGVWHRVFGPKRVQIAKRPGKKRWWST
jgi:hypothetical protein